MKKIYLLLLFLGGMIGVFGQTSAVYTGPRETTGNLGTRYVGDFVDINSWDYKYYVGTGNYVTNVRVGLTYNGLDWEYYGPSTYGAWTPSANYAVTQDIHAYQFKQSGNCYVVGQASDFENKWSRGGNENWNNSMVFNSSNSAYFTVNPLQNPTVNPYTCSTTTTNQVILNWSKWNTKDVIILRNTTGTFTDPTQGTVYNAGQTIGGSDVVYRGNQTTFTDTIVPGVTYYYKFYSENWSYYSSGTVQSPVKLENITISPTTQTVDLYAATAPLAITTGVPGIISYQWYSNTANNNTTGTLITGQTNATYSPGTYNDGSFYTAGTYYYYVVVTTGAGSCDKAVSNVATVVVNNSNTANWANIQLPKQELDAYEGIGVDVYAQVYVNGSTPGIGEASPATEAWIGYSSIDNHPNNSGNWNWLPASYNTGYDTSPSYRPNNDEYRIKNFGEDLPQGTYYIASRFRKQGETVFVYGGTEDTTDNLSGGIWNGIQYKSLKLNINKIVTWLPNTGSTAGEWNNTSGPVIKSPAIIATDITSPPSSFSVKKLTINNGVGLTIPSGNYVKVQENIINNNPGNDKLIIQNDANLIQVNETDTNSGVGATVYRNSAVPNNQYNYWSSPVTSQNLYGFYDGNTVPANSVMTYNTWNDRFTPVASGTFAIGKGYSVKGPASGSSNAAFKGLLHNGSFTYTLATSGQKYNLVGNPYASNIDLINLYTNNTSNIEPTVYFWDYTGNLVMDQQGGAYTTLYTNHNYAIFNLPAATGTKAPNATKVPDHIVKVGQGFIVQAKTSTLNFKNSQRTNLGIAAPFFGKTQSGEMNRYWLKMTTPVQLQNTLAVVYLEGANNSFDIYDSEIVAETSDNLFSFADNTKVSINGRSVFENTDVVKLGTSHFVNGNYTISIDEKEGVFANGQNIYLKDKQTGTITNLSQGSYTFTTNVGENNTRFEIIYEPEAVLATDGIDKEQLIVYRENNDFIIKSPKEMEKVEVYEPSGKLVKVLQPNKKWATLEAATLPNGMYILKIKTKDGEIVTKKILR